MSNTQEQSARRYYSVDFVLDRLDDGFMSLSIGAVKEGPCERCRGEGVTWFTGGSGEACQRCEGTGRVLRAVSSTELQAELGFTVVVK